MITNATSLANLQSEWEGVVRMRERMKLLVVATFSGGAITAPALSGVLYNLPMLLAFDVLRQVLVGARDEGVFNCKSDHLGQLMEAAKGTVSWIDWRQLRAGVRRRNEIAHDGKLFESSVCMQDIVNIEDQLRTWKVI